MKKIRIIFLLSIIIILTTVGVLPLASCAPSAQTEYLRIHVRANSNEPSDQAVKYEIKDKVVEILTPLIAEVKSFEQAAQTVKESLSKIQESADVLLKERGFFYQSSAKLKKEYFPTRVYEGYMLVAGEYLSLIIELGKADGQNWWCVVYPPLCFSYGGGKVVYKSKLFELLGW